MLAAARRSTVDNSGMSWSFVAIAQGALGHTEEALAEMTRRSPRLAQDPGAIYRGHQLLDSTLDLLVAGLRTAGWTGPGAAPPQ